MGKKYSKSGRLLTLSQKPEMRILQRILKRQIRAAECSLAKMHERYLNTFLPVLTTYLNEQFEIHKSAEFGGHVGRFDVAKAFTLAGIKIDFHLAEQLLEHACKKRIAYLIMDSSQCTDAGYGSRLQYIKHLKC